MDFINNIKISTEDIEMLLREEELKKEGYNIHYVVDSYDIIEYCFPKGIDLDKDPKIDEFENNLMGYHYLFHEMRDVNKPIAQRYVNKPILLNEYLLEVNRNRVRFIGKNTEDTHKKDNFVYNLTITKDEYKELTNDNEIYSKLKKDVHFLIASAIFNSDSVATFLDLMKNRVHYRKPETFDDAEYEAIYNAFESSTGSQRAIDAFNQWYTANSHNYIGKNTREALQEFESVARDFKAIERIFSVNEKISKSAYPKNVFLYFSNAARTSKIFEKKYLKEWYETTPVLGDKNFTIHRSIKDVVLLFLLNTDVDSDSDDVYQNLQQLHKLCVNNDESKGEDSQWAKMMTVFKNKQSKILARESIMSKLLLNETYKHQAEQALQRIEIELDIKETVSLEKVFHKEIDALSGTSGDISELQSFKDLDGIISMQIRLIDFLKEVNLKRKGMINKAGKDYITGTFHKLPILMFHSEIHDQSRSGKLMFKLYKKVLQNLTESDIFKETETEAFLQDIKEMMSSRKSNEDFERDYELIMVFMMMLVLEVDRLDEQVLSVLEFLPTLIEKTKHSLERTDESLIVSFKPFHQDKKIYAEYLYFLAWMERRCTHYERSRKTCEKAIEEFPNDARFYHGLTLADFCIYHEKRASEDTNANTARVKSLMESAEKAIQFYEQTKNDQGDNLIDGTKMSLQNLLAYLLVQECINTILIMGRIEQFVITTAVNKIEKLRKPFEELRERYSSHFEIGLTTKLIEILAELIKDEPNKKEALRSRKKDFKSYLEENKTGAKPYLDFDYKNIELILSYPN